MIVITGGAGFIGSAIIWHLNQQGIEDIIVVDDLKSDDKWKNLLGLKFEDMYTTEEFLDRVIDDNFPFFTEAIIHMGAISSTTERDMDKLLKYNYLYTKELAKYCLPKNARFIYASSAATYGKGEKGYNDDHSQLESLRPLNAYGYSKYLFDIWAKKEEVIDKIVGLKFFNVYGPNEYHKGDMRSVVIKAYEQVLDTAKIKLFKSYHPDFKDGEQKRDFIYIKDVVKIISFFLENRTNGIFNVGTGKARTWNDLANAVFKAMDYPTRIEYIDMPESVRNQYQYFTEANITKLRNAGYTDEFTSLEDGIKDYIQNYLMKNNKHLAD